MSAQPLDHGVLSGIRRHSAARQQRQHAAGIEKTIDQAMAAVEAEKKTGQEAASAAYAERHKPVPYTPEELAAARFVRTELGWERVVRVNAKTITVTTPYSWTERVAIDKVLEVLT